MNHKNSIIGRMFANAAQTNNETSDTNQTNNKSRSASPMISTTKRNLFGIRLNHDQLKQDLKDMWQDQMDRQTQNWGFDFEKLKPVDAIKKVDINASPKRNIKRFEWTKVNTKMTSFYNETDIKATNETHLMTSFRKEELINDSEYETEEEEYDDALAIPTFYKYQRRQKLNKEHLQLIHLQRTQSAKPQNAFSKMNNSKNVVTKKIGKIHRPSPRKSGIATASNNPKNLIITFSENRKDTLRSSTVTNNSKNLSNLLEETAQSLSSSTEVSAFKQPLKQQSLLDMLKQRKRKTAGTSSVKGSNDKDVNQYTAMHNLRPRTTSMN